jgi:hypothetical protein
MSEVDTQELEETAQSFRDSQRSNALMGSVLTSMGIFLSAEVGSQFTTHSDRLFNTLGLVAAVGVTAVGLIDLSRANAKGQKASVYEAELLRYQSEAPPSS